MAKERKLYSDSVVVAEKAFVSLRVAGSEKVVLEVAKYEQTPAQETLDYEPQKLTVSTETLLSIRKMIDDLEKYREAEKAKRGGQKGPRTE